jgi:hypothetical protein
MEVSGGNLWHIIVTGASFATCFVMEVASTSAGKAEPNLTEVRITSASKPTGVRRGGCPHPCDFEVFSKISGESARGRKRTVR